MLGMINSLKRYIPTGTVIVPAVAGGANIAMSGFLNVGTANANDIPISIVRTLTTVYADVLQGYGVASNDVNAALATDIDADTLYDATDNYPDLLLEEPTGIDPVPSG